MSGLLLFFVAPFVNKNLLRQYGEDCYYNAHRRQDCQEPADISARFFPCFKHLFTGKEEVQHHPADAAAENQRQDKILPGAE